MISLIYLGIDELIFVLILAAVIIHSAIRLFRRLCKQFSESSPCLPVQQGSCITNVELSENILRNQGNDLMADSVHCSLR